MLTTTDVPPNQTLFCYNLNTKINRDDLKRCLFELFCPYGKILDVVASKADPKKRGNAFIVFSSVVSATTALRSLQGRPFLSRPLGISYAKKKSDKVAVLDGTYRMRRPELRKTPAARLEKKGVAESAAQAREDVAGSPRFMYPKATSGATLFVENLPEIMNETALTILFKQYPGFQEVRFYNISLSRFVKMLFCSMFRRV